MRRKYFVVKREQHLTRHKGLTRYPQRYAKASPRLKEYYLNGVMESTWICENCDQEIAHTQAWQAIAAQCHILEKDDYPEVEAVPENRMHLCVRCHNDFDSNWGKASRMRIWPIVLDRLRSFAHLVKHLPDYLKDLL